MVEKIEQLSFDVFPIEGSAKDPKKSRLEHIESLRRQNRIEKTARLFALLRLSNQSYHAAESDLQKLKQRLNLSPETYNLLATEILLFQQGRFAEETSAFYLEAEAKMAVSAVARAIKQDCLSVEALDDVCFYCKGEQKQQCAIPEADKNLRSHIIRLDFPSRIEMKQFLKELEDNPNSVCCPKTKIDK